MFHDTEIDPYRDYNISSKNLLIKDKPICIHHRNIQNLAIELFKGKENLSNTIMTDVFPPRVLNYNLSHKQIFSEIPSTPQSFV